MHVFIIFLLGGSVMESSMSRGCGGMYDDRVVVGIQIIGKSWKISNEYILFQSILRCLHKGYSKTIKIKLILMTE